MKVIDLLTLKDIVFGLWQRKKAREAIINWFTADFLDMSMSSVVESAALKFMGTTLGSKKGKGFLGDGSADGRR